MAAWQMDYPLKILPSTVFTQPCAGTKLHIPLRAAKQIPLGIENMSFPLPAP